MGTVLLQSTFSSLQTAARQPHLHLIFFPRPPIPLFVVIVVVVVLVVVVVVVIVVVCLNAVLFRGSEIG